MDANKIKFVDDDGSIEVLEPPMTARVHVETPTEEEAIPETIEEEPSSESESVIIVSSSVDSSVEDLKSSVEDISGEILNSEAGEAVKGAETGEAVKETLNEEVVLETRTEPKAVIEKVVEQHIKELEKMESVILCLGSDIASSTEPSIGESDIIKSEEVKVPEDQDMKREPKSGALGPEEVIDKESLSLVANAVNDVRSKESAPIITPKGCCILQ
jgi:hypothetical protein